MPATEVPPPSTDHARAVRTRRVLSMILSCVTIAATVPILLILITDAGFTLSNGTFGISPSRAQLMDTAPYWIFPGIITLVLLSSLPRPRTLVERLPKRFGIVALVLSASCILYPVAMLTFSGVMFMLGIAIMTL